MVLLKSSEEALLSPSLEYRPDFDCYLASLIYCFLGYIKYADTLYQSNVWLPSALPHSYHMKRLEYVLQDNGQFLRLASLTWSMSLRLRYVFQRSFHLPDCVLAYQYRLSLYPSDFCCYTEASYNFSVINNILSVLQLLHEMVMLQ